MVRCEDLFAFVFGRFFEILREVRIPVPKTNAYRAGLQVSSWNMEFITQPPNVPRPSFRDVEDEKHPDIAPLDGSMMTYKARACWLLSDDLVRATSDTICFRGHVNLEASSKRQPSPELYPDDPLERRGPLLPPSIPPAFRAAT